jgi:rhamnogalacturonyl hydrolase YesR/lysophospholipase L1-like esterase
VWIAVLVLSCGAGVAQAQEQQQPATMFEALQQRRARRAATRNGEGVEAVRPTPAVSVAPAATAPAGEEEAANDSNTPLHLLRPDYGIPYATIDPAAVQRDLDRVYNYLNEVTPAVVEDKTTGAAITDYTEIDANSQLRRGDYRLAAYEWGVTYAGMMRLAEVTGDERYDDYVAERVNFLAEMTKHFARPLYDVGLIDPQMIQIMQPHALDDAGAVCAAMIKALRKGLTPEARPLIDNYMTFILYREHRLSDGTFARNRPYRNSVWLDDMFMSLPAIVQMGRLTGEAKYYDEAARQVKLFAGRMWVPEQKLFRHGWIESMEDHPAFFWGRANGWALLTLCEVLDALPEDHPERPFILDLLREHVRGLSRLQSGQGAGHQLLDRQDSYLETSATAIYVYGMAHAINRGWIDGKVYGPVAQLGWDYVSTQITDRGQVTGTCVGPGMGFEPAFYYHRPVHRYAAHSYGPVLLAGAEMIELLRADHLRTNDSAILYFDEMPPGNDPIFYFREDFRYYAPSPGSTRKGDNPVLFLVGDSTTKTGDGTGGGGQWGWGTFFQNYLDESRITVENHALGGRSSRTFITQGLWRDILPALRPGDYVMISMGHNDRSTLDTGRARGTLPGVGDETQTVILDNVEGGPGEVYNQQKNGPETVHTYGWYLRMYIRQAKNAGARPIVLSPTPSNNSRDGRWSRFTESYNLWARTVAEQEGVPFVDLNDITASRIEAEGIEGASQRYYMDGVHNNRAGAVLNAESVVQGLRALPRDSGLNQYLK